MQIKHRAEIHIVLNEAGNLGVKTSSQNKITNLGMLEMAKALIGNQKLEAPSPIVVPQVMA